MQIVKRSSTKYCLDSIGIDRRENSDVEFRRNGMEKILRTCNARGKFSDCSNTGGRICWLSYTPERLLQSKITDTIYLSYREFVSLGKPRKFSVVRTDTYSPK